MSNATPKDNENNVSRRDTEGASPRQPAAPTAPNVSAHTPGPWRLQACLHGGLILLRGDDNRHPQTHLQIIPEADARLIAAAPDLLSAAKDILAQFDAGYFVRNTDSDGCSDWAIKAAAPLRALAALVQACEKAEPPSTPSRAQARETSPQEPEEKNDTRQSSASAAPSIPTEVTPNE